MPYSATASVVVQAPLAKVWAAITEPEIVKQYFFGTNLETDWKVGSPIFWRGQYQGKEYIDKGHVLEFDPLRHLAMDYWSSMSGAEDKPENYMTVRYDLAEGDDGVHVTVTQGNAPTQESADHSAKNWHMVLGAMKKLVEAGG